jgi:hypothetical protein
MVLRGRLDPLMVQHLVDADTRFVAGLPPGMALPPSLAAAYEAARASGDLAQLHDAQLRIAARLGFEAGKQRRKGPGTVSDAAAAAARMRRQAAVAGARPTALRGGGGRGPGADAVLRSEAATLDQRRMAFRAKHGFDAPY